MAVDPQFGVDVYNRAKYVNDDQTLVNNILTILFGKPGFYPSIPELGMNIGDILYSFEDSFDANQIKLELIRQCSDISDVVTGGEFDVMSMELDGQPLIVFSLPVIHVGEEAQLILGVKIGSGGGYEFNFTFTKTQYI
jgi:hypothetical protein